MNTGQPVLITSESWQILGYGSQHVVFLNCEREFALLKGKVLRIRIKSYELGDLQIAELEKSLSEFVSDKYLDGRYLVENTVVKLGMQTLVALQSQMRKVEKFKYSDIYDHGLLCTNIFGLSKRVFELKPKWDGCMVSPNDHVESSCPYCSHKKRKIDFSKYCPALLFSPSKEHVHHAVKHYPFKESEVERYRNVVSEILYKDGILRTLKAVHDHNCFLGVKLNTMSTNCSDSTYLPLLQSHLRGIVHSDLAEFLITLSLKDCSIFIVIDDDVNKSHQQISIDEDVVSYVIYLIDTDIKPVSRLQDYILKNKKACRNLEHT